MPKVAEVRISVYCEGASVVVVLDGEGIDTQTYYPKRITFDVAVELVKKMQPVIAVALAKLMRKAFEAGRPPNPREEP